MSLPERVVRSTSALCAGLLRELGEVTLPPGLRQTRLYSTMVETTLRFLIEQVGQVEGTYAAEGKLAENFLVKRTLGDGIDLAGMVAFHASPVWVFAALADLTGAGRHFVDEIATSLKDEGLLDRDARFNGVDQILDGLERTSGQLATSLRYPPLDVAGLRREWNALKSAAGTMSVKNLPGPRLLRQRWDELTQEAATQGRSVFELSSLIALSTVRAMPINLLKLSRSTGTATMRTGQFFAQGLLDHYENVIREIRKVGYVVYWTREFRPYLYAAAKQFSSSHQSVTEQLLDRASKRTR